MNKICCFAGHSKLTDTKSISEKVIKKAEELILNENVTEFWVGNYGTFDFLCQNAIRILRKKYPNIKLNLVVPYLTSKIEKDNDFDNITIAEILPATPRKFHISECNKYMIRKSSFLIAYVEFPFGGAFSTLEFAKKQKRIKIFNLLS